jgi:hypothetical protein
MVENGLYGIYSMAHVPWWQRGWFYGLFWCLGIIILVCIVWLLVRYWRNRKRELPCWDQALHDLTVLSGYHPDQGKDFYIKLVATIKKYLQVRFGFEVFSKTDQEMLHYLATTTFSGELYQMLSAIIDGSLMAKFANYQVTQEQMNKDLRLAIMLVQRTMPQKNS